MKKKSAEEEIEESIRSTGFACIQCGACCRGCEDDEGLVIVSPEEVRRIMAATGKGWDEVAMPYPETISSPSGCEITLAWCLRRKEGQCIFLEENRCTVYEERPWICRTYPFMIAEEGLSVSECPGLGKEGCCDSAAAIARDLISRKEAEDGEVAATCTQYHAASLPDSGLVVVDSEGVRRIHG